jgi:hypothetical protein
VAGDGAVVGLELDAADLDVIMEVRRDLRVQLEAAPLAAQALLEALGVDLTRACRNGLPSRSLSG